MIDDARRQYGPISFSLMPGAHQALQDSVFAARECAIRRRDAPADWDTTRDLGDWRLRIHTDLDIEPLAYIRTEDGFVTSMHEVVQLTAAGYHVPIFNPGSNQGQRSRLRLINPNAGSVEVTIAGLDDAGMAPPEGQVSLTVPAGGARTVTAQELESGGDELNGQFGGGTGKWQLFVSAGAPITVVSLLESPTGHLSNLSASPGRTTSATTGITAWDFLSPIDRRRLPDGRGDRGHRGAGQ